MEKEQKCENCSAEFTVMEKDDVAEAAFCPFCGEEMVDVLDLEEDIPDDWDDQDNSSFD